METAKLSSIVSCYPIFLKMVFFANSVWNGKKCMLCLKLGWVNKEFYSLLQSSRWYPLLIFQCLCLKYRGLWHKEMGFQFNEKSTWLVESYPWTCDDFVLWLVGLNRIEWNRTVVFGFQTIWKTWKPDSSSHCGCDFKLCDFLHLYKNLLGFNLCKGHELALAKRKPRVDVKYAFTFHLVLQEHAPGSKKKETRRFLCFYDTSSAVYFYLNWFKVQSQSIEMGRLKDITSLFECGFSTPDPEWQEGIERKWVFDIDAPLDKLFEKKVITMKSGPLGNVEIERLNGFVVLFGQYLSEFLLRNNLVKSLPYFCVLTRHTNSKLSWHLTINVMGKLKHWALILQCFEQEVEKQKDLPFYCITLFVDKCTKNNKKGQYMQTLMSMKTTHLDLGTFPFTFYGFFRGNGQRELDGGTMVQDADILMRYSMCSLMIFDPWCQRMNVLLLETICARTQPTSLCVKRKREDVGHCVQSGVVEKKEEWVGGNISVLSISKTEDELSSFCCIRYDEVKEWVKGFVWAGNSSTSFLPSMRETQNVCSIVKRLREEKKCKVLVHSYVRNCGICPRIFKVLGKDYQHGHNSQCVVICVKVLEDEFNSYRAFAYCMSAKCKDIVSARVGRGWVEYTKEDYLKLKYLRSKKNE